MTQEAAILRHLEQRVLVLDGAMGTEIYSQDLSVEGDYCGCENCTDILVRTRPDVIGQIHRTFLEAGADCIETDSFGGAHHVLSEFDLQGECLELNTRAAELARAAADAFSTSDKPRFVLGSMGPGTKLISLGQIDWERMYESYREQARGLLAGGIDAFQIETCQDPLQVKCVINACLAALDEAGKSPLQVPLFVSVTIEQTGSMLVGTSIEAAAAILARYPIASLGLNCATGPTEMSEHVEWLGKHWGADGDLIRSGRKISVMPNAGLPALVEGKTVYPLRPGPFVEAMLKFVERDGVHLVGGCCGTTPEHIRQLAEAVQGLHPAAKDRARPAAASTSLYAPVEHRQDNSVLIIGERMNASGSKKFRELLEADDWDGIVSLARQQLREGAHVLDLNVDYAGRDNAADMAEAVSRVVRQVDAPLMLDSTQIKTIEAGLKRAGGKCIINSANFEDGEDKFDQLCSLAKAFGAALVIGTIDEDKEAAMARTADRKLEIATRAIERARDIHGIPVEDIFIDPLVLPISTGMDEDRRSALELVDGTRRIAERFPEVQITVGLSNVSFGLKPAARQVLNSVLLEELTRAGLTSSIMHAGKILPLAKVDAAHHRVALHLVYDRRSTDAGGTGLPTHEDPEHTGSEMQQEAGVG